MRPRTLRLALAKATVTFSTALVALAIGLTGCGDDDGGGTPTFPVFGTDTALLRVAHLSPDAGTVDVIVDEGSANGFRVDGAGFGVFSRFYEVPATFDGRTVNVKVRTPGGADALDVSFEVLRGQVLTAVVIGKVNPQIDDGAGGFVDALRAIVVPGTVTPSPDEATLSFVHAAPSVPEVRVSAVGIPSPPLFEAVSFGEATGRGTEIPPRSYGLQVRPTGSDAIAATFSGVAVEANTVYTLWAVETPEGGIAAIASIDRESTDSPTSPTVTIAPATATLRAAHLSVEAPEVQVLIDGEVVTGLESVGFGAFSDVLDITAATHRAQVFEATADPQVDDPVIDVTFTPLPGQSLTLAATGSGDAAAAGQVLVYDDQTPGPGNALVRLLHASSYGQAVSLVLVDESGSIRVHDNIASGAPATGFASVLAGTYTMEARLPALNDFLIATVENVVIEDGDVLNVYFVGDGTPPIPGGDELTFIVDPQPTAGD